MVYPRPEATGTKGTPHVCVKAGNNVVGSQAPDLQSLHLRNQRNQDVSSLSVWQVQTKETFFIVRLFVGHHVKRCPSRQSRIKWKSQPCGGPAGDNLRSIHSIEEQLPLVDNSRPADSPPPSTPSSPTLWSSQFLP